MEWGERAKNTVAAKYCAQRMCRGHKCGMLAMSFRYSQKNTYIHKLQAWVFC